jgi:hypothetical protein
MLQQNVMDDDKDTIEQFELSCILRGNFCNEVERMRLHLQWWQWHIFVVLKFSCTLKGNFYSGVERTRLHLQWQ